MSGQLQSDFVHRLGHLLTTKENKTGQFGPELREESTLIYCWHNFGTLWAKILTVLQKDAFSMSNIKALVSLRCRVWLYETILFGLHTSTAYMHLHTHPFTAGNSSLKYLVFEQFKYIFRTFLSQMC